jgi:polysaccharide export outer membrane protein
MKRIPYLAHLPTGPLAVVLLLALLPTGPLAAQQPSQAAVQAAMQQPGAADAIRARLRESGMTPDQIRARLQAAGYSGSLLDAYLGDSTAAGAAQASADHIAAMRALGLAPAATPTLPVETGQVEAPDALQSGVFGVDVFRRSTTQFLPLVSGPVPPEYRLGPGDQLVLILTGDVELTHQIGITREGFVLIPQVGQVFLSNLTMDQAKSLLADRLGRVYSGVRRNNAGSTRFELSVANVRAVQVYVLGEVTQPGAYQVSALGTTLTALYAAGGVTERANLRSVTVRRPGRPAASFDLYDYLLRGSVENDVRLENGDVVFVGVRERRAEVRGKVNRPASYDVTVRESLADLIAAAGGVEADAALSRISITRIVPAAARASGEPQRVTLDVVPVNGVIPALPIEDGDVVNVYAVPTAERNFVEISGNVFLPGKFGFEPGLTLSALVRKAGGFMPATYEGRAHISRMNPADQTRRIVPVVLPGDANATWQNDPVLQDQDSVVIYGRLPMRADRILSIYGAVNDPKTVPWRDGMTLRDLILEGGGVSLGASLDSVEVARLATDRSGGQLARTIRVPIDSTYLFDRDSLGRPLGPQGTPFRASGAPEFALEPWDVVLVFRQPEFHSQRSVTILGEVRYPGTYALRTKTDRLADLVGRAGGLSDRAYAEGVQFHRAAEEVGRINIDLPRALRSPRTRDNIVLQPGDTVIVPEFQPSVKVVGAVNSPGSVLWQPGRSIGYYIGAAGGLAHNGDGARASVRQANGEVESRRGGFLFFGGRDPEATAGATILVPIQPPEEYRDKTGLYAALASMIASTATIFIALTR